MALDFSPNPDPAFDRFARIVCDVLDVPVALVSLVEPDRQVFPGAAGLPPELEVVRQTPIRQSVCQYVVADKAPLIANDLREDPRLRDHPAVTELDVKAYAGFPLRNARGVVIGSLCALDNEPHDWTEAQLRVLSELADACSRELVMHNAQQSLATAISTARQTSRQAGVLLALSESLAETVTTAEIALAIHAAAQVHLGCLHAGIWLVGSDLQSLHYVEHPSLQWSQAQQQANPELSDSNPVGATVVRRTPMFYSTRAAQEVDFAGYSDASPSNGEGRALIPLLLGDQQVGALALLWENEREFSEIDRNTMLALASYASQAVHRAQLLAERRSAASTLQAALLSALPTSPHAELVARYRTAVGGDEVGGDWYDAVVLPNGSTSIVIGDVVGHDLKAAARMGGLRNMLRALAWAIDEPPASTLRRLDEAARDMQSGALATIVLAHIAASGPDSYRLEWSNAGHPSPLLLRPDGAAEFIGDIDDADVMVGVAPGVERRDQVMTVAAGSTLILYTDGLIETRTADLAKGQALLADAARRHCALEPGALIDAILCDLVGASPEDDVAVLAVRLFPTA